MTNGPDTRLDMDSVRERLSRARDQISRAGGVGVRIVGVTKTHPAEVVAMAVAAGVDAIGENYAQEIRAKESALAEARRSGTEVHLIGSLQSNKVRMIVGRVDVVQTVDRSSLVGELARRAPGQRVMVQVDATGEPGKGGCQVSDVPALVEECWRLGLVVEGLMTVGPTSGDPLATARAFAATRRLVDGLGLVECSMGMSGDLEIAVAEGTTMVRLGTALFGPR